MKIGTTRTLFINEAIFHYEQERIDKMWRQQLCPWQSRGQSICGITGLSASVHFWFARRLGGWTAIPLEWQVNWCGPNYICLLKQVHWCSPNYICLVKWQNKIQTILDISFIAFVGDCVFRPTLHFQSKILRNLFPFLWWWISDKFTAPKGHSLF